MKTIITRDETINNKFEYSGFNVGDDKHTLIKFKLASLYNKHIELNSIITVYDEIMGNIISNFQIISITPNNDYSFTIRAIEAD